MWHHDEDRQFEVPVSYGPRAGVKFRLSVKSHQLSPTDWSRFIKNVESIVLSQRTEVEHSQATHAWLKSIPRKLRTYLQKHLLAHDPEFIVQQAVDLADSIQNYEAYRQGLSTKAATDSLVMHDLSRLLDRCPSDVRRVDALVLQDLLAELADDYSYSANTLARHAKHWSAFFNWLISRGAVASNPCATIPKEIATRPKDEVRPEWVDALVNKTLMSEEGYWLRLLQWTGCRLREGLCLRVCDFDLAKGRIYITETKNNRIRVNPIYPAIASYLPGLLANRDPDERVLVHITDNNCYDWLAKLQHAAGIASWQPPYNAFRATRANQIAADRTISPQQAGLLLGHSATVARRSYLSPDDSLLERLRLVRYAWQWKQQLAAKAAKAQETV